MVSRKGPTPLACCPQKTQKLVNRTLTCVDASFFRFNSDSLRRRVWPLLVGLPSTLNPSHPLPLGASTRMLGGSTRTLGGLGSDDEEEEKSVTHHTDCDSSAARGAGGGAHRNSATDVHSHDLLNASSATLEDVSVGADSATTASRTNSRRRYRRCQDHYQIDLDVARCTWHLLTGDQRAQRYQMEHKRNRQVARIIRRKQRRLGLFINLTLVKSEEERLRYYQGFHDVACIFLTTLAGGPTPPTLASQGVLTATPPALELPAQVLNQVARSHLRDYLKENFVDLQTALRLTVFPMLASLDPNVHDHLYSAEMEPFFCLSWIITWFAHEVRDSALVKRLFDAFLVGHPLLPLYVSIAMILHPINRQIVLDTEPDFAILHQTLRGLPRNSSMVGWKYRPGDGYVSDDEEDEEEDDDDDDEAAAVEARLDAAVDGDIHQLRSVLDKDRSPNAPTGATSSVSTGSTTAANGSECHARVPFQELFDFALDYMQKMPPRQLLTLARRYYGRAHVRTLLKETNSIELLGDVPTWAIQPTLSTETPPKTITRILREKQQSKAVLALGLGLSDLDRRRRRRRRFWSGVVAVALFAMAVAWKDQVTWDGMHRTIGWMNKRNDPSGSSACPSERQDGQGGMPAPGVGSAAGSSLGYAEVTPEGNTMDPIVVNSQTFAEMQHHSPPPGRRPVTQPVVGTKSEESSSTKTSTRSSRNQKQLRWYDPMPPLGRNVLRQVELLARKLGSHMKRLIDRKESAPHMIADGKKKPRVVRGLKPLVNFFNTPGDEMFREVKKAVSDQSKILMDWLSSPWDYRKTIRR